jgi:general secretion pathway protein I
MRDEAGLRISWRSAERGFTLVEIMVALAVFSLAALALIRLQGVTIRGAGLVNTAVTARMVAGNVAIDAVTDARAPTIGRATGSENNGGRRWRWQRDVAATPAPGMVRIDVAVSDEAGTIQARTVAVRRSRPGE